MVAEKFMRVTSNASTKYTGKGVSSMPKGKKGTTIPADESKRDRFMRVAEPRVRGVVKGLQNLRKCANRATYDYAPDDIERIQKILSIELSLLGQAFAGQTQGEDLFSFKR